MTRRGYLLATGCAALAVAATAAVSMPTWLVWNATASAPVGLYRLDHPPALKRGDLVAVMPDMALADFMVTRGYIVHGVPLLKHVAALPGQQVCRVGYTIMVDGIALGDALVRDRLGRPLPAWRGCRRIAAGEVFLMNGNVPDSLDGRYFGPLAVSAIIGRARPVWTDPDSDGRFTWAAQTP
jgi:conjugative transfer signal peptidase TraF